MKQVTPVITLRSVTPNALECIWTSYRVAYSKYTPQELWAQIDSGKVTEAAMLAFVKERLATGHESPLEQVQFEFGLSGVSRAFSHQFVRTRVGMSLEQQSQRYVNHERTGFAYVAPPSITNWPDGGAEEWAPDYLFEQAIKQSGDRYHDLRLAVPSIPEEDARFVLPNAAATNIKFTINLRALLHVADLRLCTRAQWEYRHVVAKMRGEVVRQLPWLAEFIQVKCASNRLGYCDETWEAYQACPLSKARAPKRPPHKQHVAIMRASGATMQSIDKIIGLSEVMQS